MEMRSGYHPITLPLHITISKQEYSNKEHYMQQHMLFTLTTAGDIMKWLKPVMLMFVSPVTTESCEAMWEPPDQRSPLKVA